MQLSAIVPATAPSKPATVIPQTIPVTSTTYLAPKTPMIKSIPYIAPKQSAQTIPLLSASGSAGMYRPANIVGKNVNYSFKTISPSISLQTENQPDIEQFIDLLYTQGPPKRVLSPLGMGNIPSYNFDEGAEGANMESQPGTVPGNISIVVPKQGNVDVVPETVTGSNDFAGMLPYIAGAVFLVWILKRKK